MCMKWTAPVPGERPPGAQSIRPSQADWRDSPFQPCAGFSIDETLESDAAGGLAMDAPWASTQALSWKISAFIRSGTWTRCEVDLRGATVPYASVAR